MAYIETVTDDMGKMMKIVNIENTVGEGCVNNPYDLQVIKALLQEVPKLRQPMWNAFGNQAWDVNPSTLPSPHDTTLWGIPQLTKSFQKYANKMLSKYGFKVNVNGKLKPAKGYAVTGKTYSTIVALNVFASLGGNRGTQTYIERIAELYGDTFSYLVEEDEDQEGGS